VILEADHPDVEDFIDWKVKEELKVAALVTGSKIIKKALKAIVDTCTSYDGRAEDRFDPAANPALKNKSNSRGALCSRRRYHKGDPARPPG